MKVSTSLRQSQISLALSIALSVCLLGGCSGSPSNNQYVAAAAKGRDFLQELQTTDGGGTSLAPGLAVPHAVVNAPVASAMVAPSPVVRAVGEPIASCPGGYSQAPDRHGCIAVGSGISTSRTAPSGTAPAADPQPDTGIALRVERNFDSWHGQVMFASGSMALSPTVRTSLAELTSAARQSIRIDLVGRTDTRGDRDRNERLALGRALAVRDYFVAKGVQREKFFTAAIACTPDQRECQRSGSSGDVLRRVDIGIYRTRAAATKGEVLALAATTSEVLPH